MTAAGQTRQEGEGKGGSGSGNEAKNITWADANVDLDVRPDGASDQTHWAGALAPKAATWTLRFFPSNEFT